MGSKKSTSSSSGGGGEGRRGGNPRKVRRRTEKARIKSKVKKGISVVKKKIGFNQTKHPTEGIVNTYAIQSKKGGKHMYGSEASQATNEYLESIGEAKKNNPYYDHKGNITGYSYILTSKGKEMKYGKSQGAMGSGDPSGIMSSVPISEAMFMQQKKIQSVALAGMSLGMPMILGQGMRAIAAHTLQKPYSDYVSKFYKGQSGEANFAKAEGFANQGKDTANLAMGTTVSDGGEKKSKKLTKDTTKYFAASYADSKGKKRKFFQHGAN